MNDMNDMNEGWTPLEMADYIDGRMNLTKTCEASGWHFASSVQALVDQGLERSDAESFANYAFNENAISKGGKVDTYSSDDLLTDDQLNRLTGPNETDPEPGQLKDELAVINKILSGMMALGDEEI